MISMRLLKRRFFARFDIGLKGAPYFPPVEGKPLFRVIRTEIRMTWRARLKMLIAGAVHVEIALLPENEPGEISLCTVVSLLAPGDTWSKLQAEAEETRAKWLRRVAEEEAARRRAWPLDEIGGDRLG